jgi:anthranilate/para-aminobenzoate synthase component II
MTLSTERRDTRVPIKCDCCGLQVLAHVVGGKLVITDRRHGEKHTVSIALDTFLDSDKNREAHK